MNLNQVTISIKDVERSIAFYQKMGLRLIVKALPDYARFECPEGDSTFSLHRSEKPVKDSGTSIYFEVQDIDEKVEELIRKGIEMEESPDNKPWLWREARLKDPDCNMIILYHAGENRKNPPWKV